MLRSILAGGVSTGHRFCKAGLASCPACPHCSTKFEETAEHLWWHCPAWETQRARHPIAVQ
eukprot:4755740-Karenia_brevis.AAC.1